MKITHLNKALKLAAKLAKQSFSGSIRFKRKENSLIITVPPSLASIIKVTPVEWEDEEKIDFAVSPENLQKLIIAVSKLKDTEVYIKQEEKKLIVADTETKYTFAYEPPDDYEIEKAMENATALATIKNSWEDVARMLKSINSRDSKWSPSNIWKNVLLKGEKDGIKILTTDGVRLLILKREASVEKEDFEVKLPVSLLMDALPPNGNFRIGENERNFLIKYSDEEAPTKIEVKTAIPKSENKFPEISSIIESFAEERKGSVSSAKELVELLRKATVFKDDIYSAVLSPLQEDGKASFNVFSTSNEKMETEILTSRQIPRPIRFSPKLLMDVILPSCLKDTSEITPVNIYTTEEPGAVELCIGNDKFIIAEIRTPEQEQSVEVPAETTTEEAA